MTADHAVRRRPLVVLLTVAFLVGPVAAGGQSALERPANLPGPWVSDAGVAHFHVSHRFWVTERGGKVINTPTLLTAAGLGKGLLAGARYASNSLLGRSPNEWELFARWRGLRQSSGLADVAVTAGWNQAAGSVDGELSAAREVGPVRLLAAVRGFSSFAGGDPGAAVGGGVVWRVHRNAALAADAMAPMTTDTAAAWSVAVQLRIPTTPHTVSLHATNVYATTLQGGAFGSAVRHPDTGAPRALYGFEFTVPITFSRYFGGGAPEAAPASAEPRRTGPAPSDTAVVRMDNRLRFLPDTVRIRAGQAVRWENTSDLVHTVTADPALAAESSSVSLPAGASTFDSGDIVPDAVYVRIFDVPGTYTYFCIPHERAGMIGWVIVEEAEGR